MFGLAKKEEIHVPVPYTYPEDIPHAIEKFSQLRGNYNFTTNEDTVNELQECAEIAEQKGLNIQVNLLKRKALAAFLESRGMALIYSEKRYQDGDYLMSRLSHNGAVCYINQKVDTSVFSRPVSMREFPGNIPAEIIKNVPAELIDNIKVLADKRDPVAFIPITNERDGKWWGVAIYQW